MSERALHPLMRAILFVGGVFVLIAGIQLFVFPGQTRRALRLDDRLGAELRHARGLLPLRSGSGTRQRAAGNLGAGATGRPRDPGVRLADADRDPHPPRPLSPRLGTTHGAGRCVGLARDLRGRAARPHLGPRRSTSQPRRQPAAARSAPPGLPAAGPRAGRLPVGLRSGALRGSSGSGELVAVGTDASSPRRRSRLGWSSSAACLRRSRGRMSAAASGSGSPCCSPSSPCRRSPSSASATRWTGARLESVAFVAALAAIGGAAAWGCALPPAEHATQTLPKLRLSTRRASGPCAARD